MAALEVSLPVTHIRSLGLRHYTAAPSNTGVVLRCRSRHFDRVCRMIASVKESEWQDTPAAASLPTAARMERLGAGVVHHQRQVSNGSEPQ